MREFIIKELSKLNVKNDELLINYVDFCLNNKDVYNQNEAALHHILPRAKSLPFSEYANLSINKWNGVYLSYKNHYLAHYLLALAINEYATISAFIGMHNKDIKLNRIHENVLINSEEYAKLLKERSEYLKILNRNKVVAKDIKTGKTLKVSKEEFDNNQNLVGATIGKGGEHWKNSITVIDKNTNKKIKIKTEDFDPKIYYGHTKGFGTFKDANGNVMSVNINDQRVKSGELVGIMKNVPSKLKGTHQPGQRVKINIYDSDDKLIF